MTPEGIVVHCTAGRITASAEEIDQYHVNERGFAMIGYHFLIRKSENGWIVEHGRPEWMEGAHCKERGRNHTHIGVAVAGNYEEHDIEDEAWDLLAEVLTDICARFNLWTDDITYHRKEQELAGVEKPKACPGVFIICRWEELLSEVASRLPIPRNP